MATDAPPNFGGKHDFKLPIPPPLLHTRSGNEIYQTPGTPTQAGFTSPPQTPQGSPSKNRLPPGANDLPNVFENAMKLMPSANGSPSKANRQPQSPNKNLNEDLASPRYNDYSTDVDSTTFAPGSPTRQSNKENASPGPRSPLHKQDASYNQAAANRQAPYKQREQLDVQQQTISRGPSPAELEKLQKPSVKRLANITQLCQTYDPHTQIPANVTRFS